MNPTAESSNILRTKLHRPQIPESFVDRPLLLKRLNAGRHRPFTLVSASAGYGKTTLVSSWLNGSDTISAWVSLDEWDDDLVIFLTYFIAAVQSQFPASCRESLALLQASILPPLPVLSRTLINDLDECEQAFILVLDDFHYIQNTDIHELLNEILRHPPRPLHLVVITRQDPSLPITKLLAQGKTTEIRSRDLRFTEVETKELLQQMQGEEYDQATAAYLTQRTDGWVTGLCLVILTLHRQSDFDPLMSSLQVNIPPHIADYLVQEVVTDQPLAVQEFLLKTSILNLLNGPLCDAVAELDESEWNGQAYLEWLQKANLFTLPLSDQQGSYRYHHLFREHLQALLADRMSTDDIADLHKRASFWFSENGLIEDALHHSLAAGDTSSAVDLVVRHRHRLLNQEQGQRLERWLNLLPKEAVEKEPRLLLAEAWVQNNQNRFGESAQIVGRVAAMLEADGSTLTSKERRVLSGEIAALRGYPMIWMGLGQLALELGRHALDVTPIKHEWVRIATLTFYAIALHLAGHLDEAYKEVHKMLAEDSELTGALRHRAYISLATIEVLVGNLSGAEKAARQLLFLSETRRLYDSLSWAHYVLGFVYYQRDDLAKARDNFGQVVEWRYRINAGAATQGYVGLALSYQALGDTDRANETCQAAIAWAAESGDAGMLLETNALLSRLALLQGQTPDANHWAMLLGDTVLLMLWQSIPHLTLANVLLAQETSESLQEAADILARLRRSAEDTHNTWRFMEITALQALLKEAAGEQQAALDLLEPVLAWAEPRGYIRLFADLGPRMAGLLERLRHRGVVPEYIARILAAFPASDFRPTSLKVNLDLVDPLTNREMQTLQLLATELSFDEIATEMVVSVNTVRTHAKRTYSKLNVNSRMQAVHRASELGLL